MQISFKSVQIFVMIRGKTWQANRETAKIGLCTPLKSVIYLGFVSETTGI